MLKVAPWYMSLYMAEAVRLNSWTLIVHVDFFHRPVWLQTSWYKQAAIGGRSAAKKLVRRRSGRRDSMLESAGSCTGTKRKSLVRNIPDGGRRRVASPTYGREGSWSRKGSGRRYSMWTVAFWSMDVRRIWL